MTDWYTYVSEEFKLPKRCYKSNDKVPVTCPRCNKVDLVRLNHLKHKVKTLEIYECSNCRRLESIQKARMCFKEKHGNVNPYELEISKKKIKETLMKNHGVDCILKKPEIHQKGILAAASSESRKKAKNTQLKNHGKFNLDVFRSKVNTSIRLKASKLRETWKLDGGKICPGCKKFKPLNEYGSLRFSCTKCKICVNLYHNEYSIIRRALRDDPKYTTAESFLGCEVEFFSEFIESQFEEGMTWDNWSRDGWHLDHVIPLKFLNEDTNKIIHFYKNFRPMWASHNKSKNDRTPKILLLTGCFGSGKSTICSKLNHSFTYDSDLGHDIYDVGRTSVDQVAIFQVSMRVSSTIKLLTQFFNVETVIIQESEDVIKERLLFRGGVFKKDSISNRIKRMESLSKKYGTFSGTANECFEYLKLKLKQSDEYHR